jgi:NAD(P)-dependent dehydrogenase (short-subunit alcohol dehydrogenase family)
VQYKLIKHEETHSSHISVTKFTLVSFQKMFKSLKSATGKFFAVKCDVSNDSDVLAAFQWVKDNFGGVDILINNAEVAIDTSLTGKWL